MRGKFDHWLHGVLDHHAELSEEADQRILNELHGLMRGRRRRTHERLTMALALGVMAAVIFAAPVKLGSDGNDWVFRGVNSRGEAMYRDPMTGTKTSLHDGIDLDLLRRQDDQFAAGQYEIVDAEFWRIRGRVLWNVGRRYPGFTGTEGRTPATPKSTARDSDVRIVAQYLDFIDAEVDSGRAWPMPPERHVVDGVAMQFQVWSVTLPDKDATAIIFGRGVPDSPKSRQPLGSR